MSLRELLVGVLPALRERGERATAWILGPEAPAALSGTLCGLAATERFGSVQDAEEALRDSVRALELHALRREGAHVRSRLESCTDARENDQLLEELDSLNRRRGRLDRQYRDERGRTRILSTSP